MARKPGIDPVRWQPPPVEPLPDMPARGITVVPLPGNGPEDVVVDKAGQLWTTSNSSTGGFSTGTITSKAPQLA